MTLNERSKRVLAALVREYIASGEPVPSSRLAGAAGLGVSSATIRNILATLEENGFLQQPHTSAGRIPTDRGYRFYVDTLLGSKRPSRTADAVEVLLRRDGASPLDDSVLTQASHVLSQASRYVGFALRAAGDIAVFDRVEFVPLAATRVLVVLVARGGRVLQKVIDTSEPLDSVELRQAANYLNAEFAGLSISRARALVLERVKEDRLLYDRLVARAIRLASSTFADLPAQDSLYVDGTASLLGEQGITLATLHELLRMIDEKQRLVLLLNAYIDGPGLTVVIGAEHPDPSLRSFSLVASTYEDGDGIGTIGIIGPTRMRYSRAIAVVDGTARAVSRMLRDFN